MKSTPYELVFGQPPRQGIFPEVKGPSIMEENVEDIIKVDEEVNVLQDQSLAKGQEDIIVDIEQWHPLENTAGDNGQLEERRCSDGDEMKSSDDDLARCNEEKEWTDNFQERRSGDDQENCSKGDGGEQPKRCSHITGVNQDSREEEDHNVALSTTEKHKLLCMKADKMYRRNAERMQLKYSKAKRKKIRTFSVGNFASVKSPRIDRMSTDLHRVACIVVEVLGKEYHLYRLRYVLFVI